MIVVAAGVPLAVSDIERPAEIGPRIRQAGRLPLYLGSLALRLAPDSLLR